MPLTRPRRVAVQAIGVALLAALLATGPDAAARFERVTAGSGVEVWFVPVAGARTFSVRLAVGGGLAAEDAASVGASAAVAAWLRVGPTVSHAPYVWEAEAATAGISVSTSLGWQQTSLVLSGPTQALDTALWLASRRLLPAPDIELPVDLLSGALWTGAERGRAEAVGFHGTAVEEVIAEVLGGDAGHTPAGSRRGAERFSPQLLEQHARRALAGPIRTVIAADPSALERVRGLMLDMLDGLPGRAAPVPRRAGVSAEVRRARPPAVSLTHPTGRTSHVVVAWDLRGAARRAGLDLISRDAALATLEVLFGHPGAPLPTRLILDDPVARSIEAVARVDGGTALAIIAEVRAGDLGRARDLLLQEVEMTGRPAGLSDALIRSAAWHAAQGLRARWSTSTGRAALVDDLVASGRAHTTHDDPGRWFEALLGRLEEIDPAAVRDLAAWGTVASRRTLAEVTPVPGASSLPSGLDEDVLDTYLRITVDLRCPPDGKGPDPSHLLREKYGMQPRTYVILTRALARRPHFMQGLTQAADHRCAEYAKLRQLLPPGRVVALHDEVACGPGRLPATAKGLKALARIYERYDIDPSWYRPLVAMTREDMRHRAQVDAIDGRCPDASDASQPAAAGPYP